MGVQGTTLLDIVFTLYRSPLIMLVINTARISARPNGLRLCFRRVGNDRNRAGMSGRSFTCLNTTSKSSRFFSGKTRSTE